MLFCITALAWSPAKADLLGVDCPVLLYDEGHQPWAALWLGLA